MKFQAAIHGAKIKDTPDFAPETGKGKWEGCVAGDPDTYQHLTKKERQEWTQQLLNKHKKQYG